MAACPIIATIRVGALVALVEIVLASLILLSAGRGGIRQKGRQRILIFVGVSLALGAFLGCGRLAPRLESDTFQKGLDARNAMYDMARPMARDYPLFGTGPTAGEVEKGWFVKFWKIPFSGMLRLGTGRFTQTRLPA